MFHADHLSSRIGPAPGLSLLPVGQGHSPISTNRGRPTDAVAATLPYNRPNLAGAPASTYNSLPGSTHAIPSEGATRFGNSLADEFGSTRSAPTAVNVPNVPNVVVPRVTTPPNAPPTTSSPAAVRRPDSSGGGGNRFTVTNLQPHDIPQPTPSRQRSANATGSGPSSGSAQQQWPRAEEEKLRLYEQARAQVVKVQGLASTPVCSLLILRSISTYFSYFILHLGACHCYWQSFYTSSSVGWNSSTSRSSSGCEQNALDVS